MSLDQDDVEELRIAVVSLAERVTSLSTSLNTVNDLQVRQIEQEKATKSLEKEARGAAVKATHLESVVIPREEHERRWKEEQANLIKLRLRIRKQTFIIGGIFFALAMAALYGSTSVIKHEQESECRTRVDNSRQAVIADQQLLNSPTINNDSTLKGLLQASYEAAVRGTKITC